MPDCSPSPPPGTSSTGGNTSSNASDDDFDDVPENDAGAAGIWSISWFFIMACPLALA
jgi:hypothetical protein